CKASFEQHRRRSPCWTAAPIIPIDCSSAFKIRLTCAKERTDQSCGRSRGCQARSFASNQSKEQTRRLGSAKDGKTLVKQEGTTEPSSGTVAWRRRAAGEEDEREMVVDAV
ncbi:hypothetical protein FRC01_006456, partial [Tulasnella sp. 417]